MLTRQESRSLHTTLIRIESKLDHLGQLISGPPGRPQGDLLTVPAAAEEFCMSRQALYKLKAAQVRIGRSIRISRAAMNRLITQPVQTGSR